VNGGADPESFATDAVFFDGYVQFTASDTVPTPEDGDKLVVWLYGGDADTPEEQYQRLGLTEETKATTNLVITAGLLDAYNDPTPTNYLVSVSAAAIEPNSWHRLTIKAFTENDIPKFAVWVDEKRLSAGDVDKFSSLVKWNSGAAKSIAAISFEGTGAVDDLGFTKTAPDFAKEVVAETFTLTVTAEGGTVGVYEDVDYIKALDPASAGTYLVPQAWDCAYVSFQLAEGYTFEGATYNGSPITPDESSEESDYYFTLPMSGDVTFVITTSGGSSDYPSYIDTASAEMKQKYDEWASKFMVSDGSGCEAAFLLNVDPDEDDTLEPTSITISGGKIIIEANQDLTDVNGTVYIKTSATLSELKSASWDEADLDVSGAIEMTPNATGAFFKIKVDFE